MNPSAHNNEQQGDLSWSSENWDNPSAVSTLDQASRQYSSAGRLEWEWDPMILAQHPGSGGSTADDGHDGVRMKNQISAGTMSSLRASYNMNMLSAGLPSNFTQNPMGIFSSAGIRNYGTLDGSAQLSTSSNLHGILGTSGIPGLAATSGAGLDNDIRSFDHSRREFLVTGMHDHVKREEIYDGHARIGLNLGVRTYFSTEETAANRLGKRHRTGSPGSQVPTCQAEGCKADLSTSKQYHRRHKVCELHSKAPNVLVGGQTQRFCQQCSRFHSLEEFDDGKRSCRKRLADHNRRRRKPQPYASVSAGKSAESIGIKNEDDPSGSNRANDSKSMIIPLKCRSSPSSVSLEDSDEKPGSVGNSLHFLSSNQGFRRGSGDDQHSSHSVMQMSSQDMKRSEALLSSLSPAPLMLQNAKQHMPMVGDNDNHDQDHSVYQQHLQTVSTGQSSGPKLSLSSLGGQLGLSHRAGGRSQTMSGQIYNEIETPVPWLRPLNSRSELAQVIGRQSTMNLQHLMSNDSKSGIISTSANSQERDVQVFPSSSQNLIPRDIASPEWMLGNMTGQAVRAGSNPFGSSSLNIITGNGQLESGHLIMPLIDSSNQGGSIPSNGGSDQTRHRSHKPVEFMLQHNTGTDAESRGDDNNSRGGGSAVGSPDIKYHELHALRPYESVPSSIYDAHHNLL